MKSQKGGTTAQGAEPTITVETCRKMVEDDLKTARVFCHIIATKPQVTLMVYDELLDSVKISEEMVTNEAKRATAFLTMVLENPIIMDQIADCTQGLLDNLKQTQQNASTMADSGLNSRG